jgi:hypothetical protein
LKWKGKEYDLYVQLGKWYFYVTFSIYELSTGKVWDWFIISWGK